MINLGDTNVALKAALTASHDYPATNNPGDYHLGILGADIGYDWASGTGPGYGKIAALLQENWAKAFAALGRTTLP